ncbi:MAG: PIN domain-containing protein [Actinomycetota bacterium]|nr:PIN domain-containing protein [Actinomycetota bacterium]
MALVIDASGMIVALLGQSSQAAALRQRLATEVCHAPHLIDAEVGNVLRRRVLRAGLAPADAEALLQFSETLVDYRHQMTGALARAAWVRRQNVTFYDALYLAVADTLALPLVTAGRRLANAPGLGCVIELVGAV